MRRTKSGFPKKLSDPPKHGSLLKVPKRLNLMARTKPRGRLLKLPKRLVA